MATHGAAEPDLALVAGAIADSRRARMLMALADGRSLPASRLAQEAGVSASTASAHLSTLLDSGLVAVRTQGRFRYYRLAGPHVEKVLEALAELAPRVPITSLRAHTRTHALRAGRTCFRHLAGGLGVRLFGRMVAVGWIEGGDGRHDPVNGLDAPAAPGTQYHYRLTPEGAEELGRWGLAASVLRARTALRYCVDWTEEAHHLGGPLGTAVAARLFEAGAIVRGTVHRSVRLGNHPADAPLVVREWWAGETAGAGPAR